MLLLMPSLVTHFLAEGLTTPLSLLPPLLLLLLLPAALNVQDAPANLDILAGNQAVLQVGVQPDAC
jgi:hypothetical protein